MVEKKRSIFWASGGGSDDKQGEISNNRVFSNRVMEIGARGRAEENKKPVEKCVHRYCKQKHRSTCIESGRKNYSWRKSFDIILLRFARAFYLGIRLAKVGESDTQHWGFLVGMIHLVNSLQKQFKAAVELLLPMVCEHTKRRTESRSIPYTHIHIHTSQSACIFVTPVTHENRISRQKQKWQTDLNQPFYIQCKMMTTIKKNYEETKKE